MSDDADLLRASPAFASLTPAEAATVARSLTRRTFAAGEQVFLEGEVGRSLLVIVDGLVALTRTTPSGHTMELGRCRAGEVLGEMALLDAAPRSATATAVAPLTVLEMRRATFDQLLSVASPAASKILHQLSLLLSARLRAVVDRLEEELYQDAEDERILGEDASFVIGPVRPTPPAPASVLDDTLAAAVRPTTGEMRRDDLWRVLWGVSR